MWNIALFKLLCCKALSVCSFYTTIDPRALCLSIMTLYLTIWLFGLNKKLFEYMLWGFVEIYIKAGIEHIYWEAEGKVLRVRKQDFVNKRRVGYWRIEPSSWSATYALTWQAKRSVYETLLAMSLLKVIETMCRPTVLKLKCSVAYSLTRSYKPMTFFNTNIWQTLLSMKALPQGKTYVTKTYGQCFSK